jgi:hypothetical protein
MPRGDRNGPQGRGVKAGKGAGAGIGIISGIAGIVWDFLKKYKRAEMSNSVQGSYVQADFGMRGKVEKAGVSTPTPQTLSPDGLLDLKKNSRNLQDQLNRIAERLSELEAKK